MRYLIVGTFENQGQPLCKLKLCDGLQEKKEFLEQIIWDTERNKYYPTTNRREDENGEVWEGTSPSGKWAVRIKRFTANQQIMSRNIDTLITQWYNKNGGESDV